jgi:hypothetical protein
VGLSLTRRVCSFCLVMSRTGILELTPSKRGRILALRNEGYTYREIATKIGGVSASACWKTVDREKKYHTRKTLPRSGRPSVISHRDRRAVLRDVQKHRFKPFKSIAEGIQTVTTRQVKQIAHEAGYHRRVACRKPFINRKQAGKRRAWAAENQDRDWEEVLWSDEASFELGERPGRRIVTRRAGEEYLPETIEPTYRSGRKSLMIWASIATNKPGPIVRLSTTPEMTDEKGKKRGGGINGERYTEQVLKGPMKTWIDAMEKERGRKMFMVEDGAPAHRSAVANRARTQLGIRNLTHPPNSPDLSPLEPLWFLVKTRVADTPGSSNSLDKLWDAIQKVWSELSEEDIRKHTGQMKARVEAVKTANGYHTRF